MKSEVRQWVGWTALLCGLLTASCSPNPQSGESSQSPVLGSNQSAVAEDGSEFSGSWVDTFRTNDDFPKIIRNVVNIEKNGSTFLVRFTTDNDHKEWGVQGVYPATYQNGILQISNPKIGGIAYSSSENSIFVSGRKFVKTSEVEEEKRVSDAQAAEGSTQPEKYTLAQYDSIIKEATSLDGYSGPVWINSDLVFHNQNDAKFLGPCTNYHILIGYHARNAYICDK